MSRQPEKAADPAKDAVQSARYAKAALDEARSVYYAEAAKDESDHSRAENNRQLSSYYAQTALAAKDTTKSGVEAETPNRTENWIADLEKNGNLAVQYAEATVKIAQAAKDKKLFENCCNAAKEAATNVKEAKAERNKHSGNETKSPPDPRDKNYPQAARDRALRVYYAEAARDASWSAYYAHAATNEDENTENAAKDLDMTLHCAEAARDAAKRASQAEAAKDDSKWNLRTFKTTIEELMKDELTMVRRFRVDVTLDPNTNNPALTLSNNRKQVENKIGKPISTNDKNRCSYLYVLGKQKFSSGKFYFEIDVKGKMEWDVGVVKNNVDRGKLLMTYYVPDCWMIWLRRKGKQVIAASHEVLYLHPAPEKVGVFVDYEGGLVSFYDVDTAALIYCFTDCDFCNQKLRPCFSPWDNYGGPNSTPLIICSVDQAGRCSDKTP